MIFGVDDPGMMMSLTSSQPLIPTIAGFLPNPYLALGPSSVVHCMSEYKNITKDWFKPNASTH